MKTVLLLASSLVLSGCVSTTEITQLYDQEPARVLKPQMICREVQVPIYGLIERPASPGEVFSGAVIGGVIGDKVTNSDGGAIVGAIIGGSVATERKRERAIVDYRTSTQCKVEYR